MNAIDWKNPLLVVLPLLSSGRLVVALNMVLVVLLAAVFAQLTWQLLPQPEMEEAPAALSAKATKGTVAQRVDKDISQLHLFGKLQATVAAAPKPEVLPETKLKLTLRGLIASSNPAEARAIIADPSGKGDFYKVGDTLPGNAVLEEIHVDRIVLKRGVNFETLRLPKEALALPGQSRTRSRTQSNVSTGVSSNYNLREYRDALLNNPQQVADLIRVSPVREGGKFVGYRLQQGKDPAFLTQYGLMVGDVIKSINGKGLDNPMSMMRDLAKADKIDLEIERNGRRQFFSLPIN